MTDLLSCIKRALREIASRLVAEFEGRKNSEVSASTGFLGSRPSTVQCAKQKVPVFVAG